MDQIAELLPVARASPGVDVEHHIAGGSVELNFSGKAISIVCKRPAMNLEDQRVGIRGIESGRFRDPALDLSPIK